MDPSNRLISTIGTMAAKPLIVAAYALLTLICVRLASANDALETLHRAAAQGLRVVPNQEDRRIIRFWLNAGRVEGFERCTVIYIRQLLAKIDSDQQFTRLTNLDRLYSFAEFDLLTNCGLKVARLAEEVMQSLQSEQIRRLEGTADDFDLWYSRRTDGSFMTVAEGMMYVLGFDKCLDKADYLKAWNQGPCSAVLSRVNRPDALPLYDYVKMVAETRVHPFDIGEQVDPVTKSAVSIIRYCNYFRSDHALVEAWDALQTSHPYQRIKHQYASLSKGPK